MVREYDIEISTAITVMAEGLEDAKDKAYEQFHIEIGRTLESDPLSAELQLNEIWQKR